MSLIDDLRAGLDAVPPSHVPTPAELPGLLGALLVYVEHGAEAFAQAAENGHQGFVDLFHPEEAQARQEQEQAARPPDARDAEIAQLKTQLAALQGTQQQTTGTVTPELPSSGYGDRVSVDPPAAETDNSTSEPPPSGLTPSG